MGRGLIGQDVGSDAPADELGQDVGRVAEQGDGEGHALPHGFLGQAQGLVQIPGQDVDVSRFEPPLDAVAVDLDDDSHALVHGHGQGLGPAHAAKPGGESEPALEGSAEVLAGHGGQRLVGPLEDALGADVDPAAGRHLAVHGQSQCFETAELVPVGPLRDDQGVGDEDPGRLGVRPEHRDGLARLHDKGFVVLELLQAGDDGPIGLPVPGCLARTAVNDELRRLLGHLRVEVVHEHPQGPFLGPALGDQPGAPRGPDIQDRILARFRHFLSPLRRFV